MTQAIRRGPRMLRLAQYLRRLRGAMHLHLSEATPRGLADWGCFAGMVLWFFIVGLVFARWWGGA